MQKREVESQVSAWLDLNDLSLNVEDAEPEGPGDFTGNLETLDGVIKWFRPDKEFGFITQSNVTEVFLQISMIENLNGTIYEGRKVKFSKIEKEQGPVAVNVVLL